VLTIKLTCQ